ncbi:MAG: tetratricopeptide repeat protein [Actinobacteria bacterium]|nr:tetratricopeptide repeat protein [Actinomycetota bacterium]
MVKETTIERRPREVSSGDALPEEIEAARMGRNPVLFLPGFLRLNALTSTMRRRLKNLDFEVYTMRPPFLGSGDLRRYAQALREKMREMRVLLGARKLSLIGQGTGGLAARYAVEQLGAHEYLDKLVMLGTPNHGSLSFYPFGLFAAAREALPTSAFLHALNEGYRKIRDEDELSIYVSIYTPLDLAVVPWWSSRLEGAENLRARWPTTHMGLVRSRRIAQVVAGLLEGEAGHGAAAADRGENLLLRELTENLEKNPMDEGDLFRRGRLLFDHGYFSLAVKDFTRLIKLRPDLPEAYMLRGKALRRKINPGENPIYNRAVRDFNQAIRMKPGWAEAYYERGVCYALLNAWPEAVDSWDRALIIDRDLYPAYLARGLGRMKRGDFAGAVEDFTEVLRIQPDEPEATRFLSELGV